MSDAAAENPFDALKRLAIALERQTIIDLDGHRQIRRDQKSAVLNERRLPFHVAVEAPAGGFGRQIVQLHTAISALGSEIARGRGFKRDDQDFAVWCFPDKATACACLSP